MANPCSLYDIALKRVATVTCCYYCISKLELPEIVLTDLRNNYGKNIDLCARFKYRHPDSYTDLEKCLYILNTCWNTIPLYYAIPNIFPNKQDPRLVADLRGVIRHIYEKKKDSLFAFMRSHDIYSAKIYLKYWEVIEYTRGKRYHKLCERCYIFRNRDTPAMEKVVYHWNVSGPNMIFEVFGSNLAWCENCQLVFLGSIKFKSWRSSTLCLCPRRPHDALFCCMNCYRSEVSIFDIFLKLFLFLFFFIPLCL